MPTERLNGTKVNFDRLTDTETLTVLENTAKRFRESGDNLRTVLGYAMLRGLVSPEQFETPDINSLFSEGV